MVPSVGQFKMDLVNGGLWCPALKATPTSSPWAVLIVTLTVLNPGVWAEPQQPSTARELQLCSNTRSWPHTTSQSNFCAMEKVKWQPGHYSLTLDGHGSTHGNVCVLLFPSHCFYVSLFTHPVTPCALPVFIPHPLRIMLAPAGNKVFLQTVLLTRFLQSYFWPLLLTKQVFYLQWSSRDLGKWKGLSHETATAKSLPK